MLNHFEMNMTLDIVNIYTWIEPVEHELHNDASKIVYNLKTIDLVFSQYIDQVDRKSKSLL